MPDDINQNTDINENSSVSSIQENAQENTQEDPITIPIKDKENTISLGSVDAKLMSEQIQEPLVDTKKKEKEIRGKKRRFRFFLVLFTFFIILLISIPAAVKYYKRNYIKNEPPVVQEETEEQKKKREEEVEAQSKVQYNSSVFKLSLEYPKEAKITEQSGEENKIKKLEIGFDKQDGQEVVTTDNLKEGYIFKVSTFSLSQRNLDQIAEVKKESILAGCPSTATVSKTETTTIDGVDSRTFEVFNCELDYKFTYSIKGGINYEFMQVFKGDLGFKQAYKMKTEEILSTVKFYEDNLATSTENDLFTTYKNDTYKFSFDHPKFMSDCCDMAPPIVGKSTQILVLGDPSYIKSRSDYDGIGIFVDDTHRGVDFNTFLEKQKSILKDDYVVVKGEVPKPEDISIKVGDKDAVMLKGYSWRDCVLVYVDITKEGKTEKALIISIKNVSGESFEKKVDDILKSFKFF